MKPSMLALAAIAAATLALPAHAAVPAPQISDPAGDVLLPDAGADIVSGTFTTSGTTAKVGRKTVYTPTKLVVTLTFAADVTTTPVIAQMVTFSTGDCADFYLESYSGGTFGTAGCLTNPFDFVVSAKGRTLTFSLPFATIGKAFLRPGAVLTALHAYTAAADPALGYETGEFGGDQATLDSATSTASYVVR